MRELSNLCRRLWFKMVSRASYLFIKIATSRSFHQSFFFSFGFVCVWVGGEEKEQISCFSMFRSAADCEFSLYAEKLILVLQKDYQAFCMTKNLGSSCRHFSRAHGEGLIRNLCAAHLSVLWLPTAKRQ